MSENSKTTSYEVREGKFSLNKSTIKREDDGKAYPDWFGNTLINGVPYKIAGWTSKSQNDNAYISCTIQEKVDTSPVENDTTNSTATDDLLG